MSLVDRVRLLDRIFYFGLAVRKLRKARGFTQAELARKARLSATHVSRIERGLSPPALDTVFALADALRAKPSVLMLEVEALHKEAKGRA